MAASLDVILDAPFAAAAPAGVLIVDLTAREYLVAPPGKPPALAPLPAAGPLADAPTILAALAPMAADSPVVGLAWAQLPPAAAALIAAGHSVVAIPYAADGTRVGPPIAVRAPGQVTVNGTAFVRVG